MNCNSKINGKQQSETNSNMQDSIPIQEAIKKANSWMNISGVEGIGAGKEGGELCILVYTSKPDSAFQGKIPDTFHNYPVVFRRKGKFKTQ